MESLHRGQEDKRLSLVIVGLDAYERCVHKVWCIWAILSFWLYIKMPSLYIIAIKKSSAILVGLGVLATDQTQPPGCKLPISDGSG